MKKNDSGTLDKTVEHIAWELLCDRMAYLNTFDGNRNQMEPFTIMVLDAMRKARAYIDMRPVQIVERGEV